MKGIEWKMVAGIVIVVLVVLAAVGLLIPVSGFDIQKYLGVQPILGVAGELTWDIEPSDNPFDKTEFNIEHLCDNGNCISTGDEWQPSELGCAIANDIFNDFSKNGNLGSRAIEDGKNCIIHYIKPSGKNPKVYCLVNDGFFRLEDTNPSPPSWWEDDVLSPLDCSVCDEPNFDEICINKNLMKRKIGASDFCKGTFGHPTEGAIRFGNCRCAGGGGGITQKEDMGNSDAWEASCDGYNEAWGWYDCDSDADDFCDNDDDKIMWVSDSPDTFPPPTRPIKDQYSDDIRNHRYVYPHLNYMYGVFWKSHEEDEQYKVLFVRTVSEELYINFDFIVESLSYDVDNVIRFNELGNFYRLPRIILNATVTPVNDKPMSALITEMQENIGYEYQELTVSTKPCNDITSCFYTEASRTDSKKCGDLEQIFSTESIILRTNVPGYENGFLDNDTEYVVQITNWFNKFRSCEGWNDLACFDTNCYDRIDRTITIADVNLL